MNTKVGKRPRPDNFVPIPLVPERSKTTRTDMGFRRYMAALEDAGYVAKDEGDDDDDIA